MSSDPGAILPPMAFLTRAVLGFPWPQATATGFLWTSTATQMHSFWRGEAALLGLSVAHGEVRVVDVGLVNPDGVAQHDPVPVVGHRGEHAVAPLEGRLVGDAARLGRALDGDVATHEPDEGDPGGERLAAVLEDGAGEGGEPPAAAAAAPPRDPGRGRPVLPGAVRAAFWAPQVSR